MYQPDSTKGLKGVEFPEGPITFDLEFSNVYLDGKNNPHDVDEPLIWAYSKNISSAAKQRSLPSGVSTDATGMARSGSRTGTFLKSTGRTNECWNGGDWIITQDAEGIHVTVDNYIINPFWFPHTAESWWSTSADFYEPGGKVKNIAYFSTGVVYLVVPFGGDIGI